MMVMRDGKKHYVYAHRFSWVLHYGEIPEGLCVCHHCDNPICVNPRHLFLGTVADNNYDCRRKGRMRPNPPRGERHPRARLTEAQVCEIRKLYKQGYNRSQLVQQFKVSLGAISHIVKGRSWRYISS